MNLSIDDVKAILKSKKVNMSTQYYMAQYILELHERVAELEAVIDDWKLADKKERK